MVPAEMDNMVVVLVPLGAVVEMGLAVMEVAGMAGRVGSPFVAGRSVDEASVGTTLVHEGTSAGAVVIGMESSVEASEPDAVVDAKAAAKVVLSGTVTTTASVATPDEVASEAEEGETEMLN